MAKLADASALGADDASHGGSSPLLGINKRHFIIYSTLDRLNQYSQPLLWNYLSKGLKQELLVRSRVLLQNEFFQEYELSDDEIMKMFDLVIMPYVIL